MHKIIVSQHAAETGYNVGDEDDDDLIPLPMTLSSVYVEFFLLRVVCLYM